MSTPLRDLLTTILFHPPARAEFATDPERFLGEHGWDDLDGADVQAALGALADELPIEQASRLAPALDLEPGLGPASAVDGLQLAISVVDEGPASLPLDDVDPTDGIDGDGEGPTAVALAEDSDLDLDGYSDLDVDHDAGSDRDVDLDGVDDGVGDLDDEPSPEDFGAGSGNGAAPGTDEHVAADHGLSDDPAGDLDSVNVGDASLTVDRDEDPFGEARDSLTSFDEHDPTTADHDQPGDAGEPDVG
jgi:hypothetical protein